jgi:hypothetical protein
MPTTMMPWPFCSGLAAGQKEPTVHVRQKGQLMNEQFDKSRFDALMTLADYMQRRADGRRELEWKTSFALWALLVAVTYYAPERPQGLGLGFLGALLFLIAAFYAYFANEVRIRTRLDVEKSFWYVDQAKAMLPTANLKKEPESIDDLSWLQRFRFRDFFEKDLWSTGLRIATTALLAFLSFWFFGAVSP